MNSDQEPKDERKFKSALNAEALRAGIEKSAWLAARIYAQQFGRLSEVPAKLKLDDGREIDVKPGKMWDYPVPSVDGRKWQVIYREGEITEEGPDGSVVEIHKFTPVIQNEETGYGESSTEVQYIFSGSTDGTYKNAYANDYGSGSEVPRDLNPEEALYIERLFTGLIKPIDTAEN